VIAFLARDRATGVLLLASLVLASVWVLSALPADFVLGTGPYWVSPSGGSHVAVPEDANQVLVAYQGFQRAPWAWPLLRNPNLAPPTGVNIFWMDAAPWVSLLGKLVFTLTGQAVNLLGAFVVLCLVLPGVALTGLVAALGQRSLAAMLAATALGCATPYLWFRWGHIPHSAHVLPILALWLYVADAARGRFSLLWPVLLVLALLTNVYLFVMAGGIWAASLARGWWAGALPLPRALGHGALGFGCVLATMVVTGILGPELGSAGADGYGLLSLNLLSPIVPQYSGVIPALRAFRVGNRGQVEGFAWLGMGALLLLLAAVPALPGRLRGLVREHWPLLLLFAGFLAFAVSNQVYVASHRILYVPLSEQMVEILGTFRSGGRFFWPVGYMLMAGAVALVARRYTPRIAVPLLLAAALLQLADIMPLRRAVAASAAVEREGGETRRRIQALLATPGEVIVYPSWMCVEHAAKAGTISGAEREAIQRVGIDIQLAAARAGRKINSVYAARQAWPDCAAEEAAMRATLRHGAHYFYVPDFNPAPAQLPGQGIARVCTLGEGFRHCRVPSGPDG